MVDPAEAARWGIAPGFHDVFGMWHETTPRAREALTAAISRGRPTPAVPGPADGTTRAYQCGDRRMWGLAVQLYALRSFRNWGHGDFGDLARLIDLLAPLGCGAIGLNPLHALFLDRPDDASPYSPNSRVFLNPLYIAIDQVPECPDAATLGVTERLAEVRATEEVRYGEAAALKLVALRSGYRRFRNTAHSKRRHDFEIFRAEAGEPLQRFAAFEVLRRRFGQVPWWEWPEDWRWPSPPAITRVFDETASEDDPDTDPLFHVYLQWLAGRQLQHCQEEARRAGMPIGLYVDLAVGVDPAGADAWAGQDEMLTGVSIGAPPDEYNRDGQNWGLTGYNPQSLMVSHGAPLREMLDAVMRHAGAIRIDHVLGLMRLYLIPRGATAVDGAYVSYPFEVLLDVIVDESQRRRCVVIGEDLGTVPEGFRDALARRGLWSYQVMLFEREHGGGFRHPSHYRTDALTTFNTHDLPTFAGWMAGHDLRTKRALNIDPGESDDARAHSRHMLAEAVRMTGGGEGFGGAAAFLAQTPARLVIVALEDILGVEDQVNIPGTIDEHPNWRRRLPVAVEALAQHDGLKTVAAVFAQAGRASDSANI
ncbi:MAG: 4-alpha-glucanotransferase [Pseudolabrys sp.]